MDSIIILLVLGFCGIALTVPIVGKRRLPPADKIGVRTTPLIVSEPVYCPSCYGDSDPRAVLVQRLPSRASEDATYSVRYDCPRCNREWLFSVPWVFNWVTDCQMADALAGRLPRNQETAHAP